MNQLNKLPESKMTRSIVVMMALLMASAAVAEEAIIVNPAVTVGSIGEDSLKDLFLGRKTTWDDGSRVVVVVLKEGASHEALMHVLGKNPQQFLTSWKKLVFTGKGAMPEQVENEEQLVALVARTPGAIGFVDKVKVRDGVKAVSR
jgi:ABC-type phosphate transport system substrate-binding protein